MFFTLTFNFFYRIGIYSSSNADGILTVYPLDKNELVKMIIKVFLFSGGSQLSGATWFLRVLFCVTVSNAIIVLIFNKLHIQKMYSYSMLIVTGIGAMFMNCNYLRMGDILEKVGLQAYFAGYFAYMLGILLKKWEMIEKNIIKNKIVFVSSFGILCILNCMGKIELNVGYIKNIVFYIIASLAGWILICALANITSKFNCLLSYIGQKSIWILGLHFLSFKLISFIWIKTNNMSKVYLAVYPVIDQSYFLWIAYLVAGVAIPLFIELMYRKFHYRVIGKEQQ